MMQLMQAKKGVPGDSCYCVGPQPGFPRCPCAMRGLIKRDGRWVQPERDLGPVIPKEREAGMTDKLRVLDLFAGIGGFSLGLERTGGFETVAFCEIEEFPRRVLAKNWPKVPCYHDVRELTADTLSGDGIGPVDVITGGFPCQDTSVAAFAHGRAGVNGRRTGLYSHLARLANELGASYVIFENVRGLLTDGLIPVLQSFCEIGFNVEWNAIPASRIGSLQNRDRVWAVAYPGENGSERLFKSIDTFAPRQRGAYSQEDLPGIYADPFGSTRGPQPLVCGGRRGFSDWVDRIGACGNSAHPAIPEMIGNAILEREAAA